MAYTQTPGRGNFDKTGNGLPGVLNSGSAANTSIDPPNKKAQLSEKAKTSIENISAENKLKLAVEARAVSDSASVASKSLRSNVYKRAQEGSEAANRIREAGGVDKVVRFNNPHMYQSYEPRTGEHDTYLRGKGNTKTGTFVDKKVETDFKKAFLNKKSNEITVR